MKKTAKQPLNAMPTDCWQDKDVLDALQALRGNTTYDGGKALRDHVMHYVNGVGAVPWQDRAIAQNVSNNAWLKF